MEEEMKNEKAEGEETGLEEEAQTQTEDAGTEEIKAEETKVQETGPEEERTDTAAEPEKPLDKMTATELREIARAIPDVDGVHAMKKQDLLEVIKKARGIQDEKPAIKGAKEIDVKSLKESIARLKDEKAGAREAKDRKKVDIIRRRINRLKKRTRKAA